jgi:hypothetical protein
MAKMKLDPLFLELSGTMGNFVYRRSRRGEVVVARRPLKSRTEPSEAQKAHRERFSQAVAYARYALKNEELSALYEIVGMEKQISAFNAAVTDFLHPPAVVRLDLSEYRGQPGQTISFRALDDVAVVSARVAIMEADGHTLESGEALETEPGSGAWVYTAAGSIPAGTRVEVRVTATDRPGGTGVMIETMTL